MATRHVVYPGSELGSKVDQAVTEGEYESVSGFYSEAAEELLADDNEDTDE